MLRFVKVVRVSLCLVGVLATAMNMPAAAQSTVQGIVEQLWQPIYPSAPSCDTSWIGFKAGGSDINHVGVGGNWDFDADISDTDSTYWTPLILALAPEIAQLLTRALDASWTYITHFDWGNEVIGCNTKAWQSKTAAGKNYRKQGIIGVWHVDDFGPKKKANGAFGDDLPGMPTPLNGQHSAWCGLRAAGDYRFTDELTKNPINADLVIGIPGNQVRSVWPGYGDGWDQLLYHDVVGHAGMVMYFKLRTELSASRLLDNTGWFSPDPSSAGNFVPDVVDSFMVWVGIPRDTGEADVNCRWLSEVIDFGQPTAKQPQMLYALTGTHNVPVSIPIPDINNGGVLRIVLQVKTNSAFSDQSGLDTIAGAVTVDDIDLDGGAVEFTFEDTTQIRVRSRIKPSGLPDPQDPAGPWWIATGRATRTPKGHIESLPSIPFANRCSTLRGAPQDGSSQVSGFDPTCEMAGNVLLLSDHDAAEMFHTRDWQLWCSPTIRLHGPYPNPQGVSGRPARVVLNYDFYSGANGPETAVFYNYGVRIMGAGTTQAGGDTSATWLLKMSHPLQFSPSQVCGSVVLGDEFSGLTDWSQVDSLQIVLGAVTLCERFEPTACGDAQGIYFDNVRVGLLSCGTSDLVRELPWNSFQDTFPFNEGISPGSSGFDTTTALVATGVNLGDEAGGEGVIPGDSLVVTSGGRSSDVRMDLCFRIKPGPGSYSIKGNMSSALWKVPSNPGLGTAAAGDGSFWGQYMKQTGEQNGQVGSKPTGHTASRWDPQTWNSARMDSAQLSLYPLVFRNVGIPTADTWQGTYHEADPKGGAGADGDFTTSGDNALLAKTHNLCYLVVQMGPLNQTNICCDAPHCAALGGATYPPAGYPGGTTTAEGTKILPDGLFTPGTHVQYFVRRSPASVPLTMGCSSPDTTMVNSQTGLGGSFDQLRYDSFDVLPDLWKSLSYGGSGLACLLYVDAGDRRGAEPAVVGALDSLGYGSDNGADRGWKAVSSTNDPDNPAGFVPANLGAMGLAYDKFDTRGAEGKEGGRLGCRIVGGGIDAGVADRQCKQGPTVAMLDRYYNTIIWSSADLDNLMGAMHDGSGAIQEQSDDAGIINQWLDLAASGNEKAFWGNGDGLTQDLNNSGTASMTTLLSRMGGLFVQDNYFDYAGNLQAVMIFKPQAVTSDKFHVSRRYGLFNSCFRSLDIIDADGSVAGAERAARYEDTSDRGSGSAGPFYSSVYRRLDSGAGRFYATLLDGFSFDNLRGWDGTTTGSPIGPQLATNDYGRRAWMQDALNAFNLCARINPVIGVGDVPGQALNFVRGAFPNPSVAGAASVRFSLAQSAKVTIRFYNVAGRLVHEATVDGHVGADNLYRWDGTTSSGAKASSGVYFYRLSAPGVQFQNNSQRMVLLGRNCPGR